ncbi:PepSY-associated TM helix domain-containing protein [Galbibacter sp. EGI 63066]|uniref:PepSY-associated TM helix domain-containing protein n=1 Tax=Galbibacter sp. EGI 63066 TaxID=2993559 RepID=UPI0022487A92|nr:PepSY-associated TM helix domain-containing protein [Galbibacter sp. EGI 63066]MCX2679285.1 PepSY-associated TM helix domain-containing protein [Galbibacter sp. EGI 63066]
MKQLIKKLHLWLGLASGLVVFILGITGCIYVFEEELKHAFYREWYDVAPQQNEPLQLEQLLPIAQEALGKDRPVKVINVPAESNKSYRFMTFKNNPSGWNYFNIYQYYQTVFINPYNGQVLKVQDSKMEFFRIVVIIHYNLLLGSVGKQIVGWSTVVFICLLLSGLVLWWPKNKTAAKQVYWFRWRPTTKWKRKNYDLHNILGFYILGFGLVIALTGLVWAFNGFSSGVDWLANGGVHSPKRVSKYVDRKPEKEAKGVYDVILQDLAEKKKQADSYEIRLNNTAFLLQGVTRYGNNPKRHQVDIYQYHPKSGELIEQLTYEEKTNGEKLKSMNYTIHVGSILGLPGKILAFFVSLIIASLPITGFFVWYNRTYGKR